MSELYLLHTVELEFLYFVHGTVDACLRRIGLMYDSVVRKIRHVSIGGHAKNLTGIRVVIP